MLLEVKFAVGICCMYWYIVLSLLNAFSMIYSLSEGSGGIIPVCAIGVTQIIILITIYDG